MTLSTQLTPDQQSSLIEHNSPEFGQFSFYMTDHTQPAAIISFLGGLVHLYNAALLTGTPKIPCITLIAVFAPTVGSKDQIKFLTHGIYEYHNGVSSQSQLNQIIPSLLEHVSECYTQESIAHWAEESKHTQRYKGDSLGSAH